MAIVLTNPKEIIPIIFGGKSIFTLHSTASDTSYTYMVEEANKKNPNDPNEVPVYFVKLLTGPDNLTNYTYMGMIFGRRNFILTKKSKLTNDAPSVIAFTRSFRSILGSTDRIPEALEFIPSTRCARCGRTLTVTKSCKIGFGPECAEIVGAEMPMEPYKVSHGDLRKNFQTRLAPAPKQTQNFMFDGLDNAKEHQADMDMAAADALRYTRIKKFHDSCNDFGDAKYLALAEEAGITIEDLRWFSKHQKNDSDYAVPQPEHYMDAVVERAVAEYKNNFPEDYYQDGSLTETEAHAIAVKKFQKELTGAIS